MRAGDHAWGWGRPWGARNVYGTRERNRARSCGLGMYTQGGRLGSWLGTSVRAGHMWAAGTPPNLFDSWTPPRKELVEIGESAELLAYLKDMDCVESIFELIQCSSEITEKLLAAVRMFEQFIKLSPSVLYNWCPVPLILGVLESDHIREPGLYSSSPSTSNIGYCRLQELPSSERGMFESWLDVSTLSVLCGKQLEQSVVACRYRTLDDNGHGHLNLGEARCEDEWFDVTMVHAWVGGKDNGATDALNHLPDSGCNIKVEHSEVMASIKKVDLIQLARLPMHGHSLHPVALTQPARMCTQTPQPHPVSSCALNHVTPHHPCRPAMLPAAKKAKGGRSNMIPGLEPLSPQHKPPKMHVCSLAGPSHVTFAEPMKEKESICCEGVIEDGWWIQTDAGGGQCAVSHTGDQASLVRAPPLAVLSTPAPVSSLAKSTLAGPLVNSRTPVGERRQGQGVKWFILDDTQCKPHVPMCHKFPHVGTGTTDISSIQMPEEQEGTIQTLLVELFLQGQPPDELFVLNIWADTTSKEIKVSTQGTRASQGKVYPLDSSATITQGKYSSQTPIYPPTLANNDPIQNHKLQLCGVKAHHRMLYCFS
ncbi:hypothetical protein FIBSPDRAFT_884780 [Athelia psychrophila]|uniref:Uncharacterized protein n=1 Tax=Athelia psychrophila TaxID=1759441 RepID=A0A166SS06_9AGAM|nr:hypothetical protein FIBSPDRAFT_884780 [Fibularhizoctonia sp. CBS 109695]